MIKHLLVLAALYLALIGSVLLLARRNSASEQCPRSRRRS